MLAIPVKLIRSAKVKSEIKMSVQITEEDVRRVAKLSRLRLSEEQTRHFAGQLSHVLDYIAKLNELDVTGVEPMAHAGDVVNVLREDVEKPGMEIEAVLRNAPERMDAFFQVPKVIGEGSGA